MIKRLDRYVLRELSVPVFASTFLVAALFAANELIALFQQLSVQNVPILTMQKLALLRMPFWLTFTFPVGVAMGSSLAMSRLVREGELTAMRSAGISIWRVLRPVLLVGLSLAVASFFMSDRIVPKTEKEHKKLSVDAMVLNGMPNFEQNVMIKLSPYNVTFREMKKVGTDRMALSDVLMVKMGAPGEAVVFFAPTGTYDRGNWFFPAPRAWLFRDEGLVDMHQAESIQLNQKIKIEDFVPGNDPRDETREELWARIKRIEEAGGRSVKEEVMFYERFAVPTACLVFALASSFLAIRFSKASAFQGLMLSLVMALAYFNIHVICTTIVAGQGWLEPMYATWLPIVLFGVLSIFMGRKLE